MSFYLCIGALFIGAGLSLYFSSITYALRDFSRAKLADWLGRHNRDQWFETLTEQTEQYVFVTAVCRQMAILLIWLSIFAGLEMTNHGPALRYAAAVAVAAVVSLFFTIAFPLVIAKYMAEPLIGASAPVLHGLRRVMSPLTPLMRVLDDAARRALGVHDTAQPKEIEREILSAIEEGEKEGVVDEQERELIENVIEFRDATAGHIMTARTEVHALDVTSNLDEARELLVASGHSRLPVYEGSLDKILGILHSRDLIKSLGHPDKPFDLRAVIRPAMFTPETKPLRNLLNDFRAQKVHLAIVLDEYGGMAGLVTIEDILEELVGEITDEHESMEEAMFRRSGPNSAEADARLTVAELNRQMGLELPVDAGYETLGGYLIASLGGIPDKGSVHQSDGTKFTVLESEPRRILRVKIEASPRAAAVEQRQ